MMSMCVWGSVCLSVCVCVCVCESVCVCQWCVFEVVYVCVQGFSLGVLLLSPVMLASWLVL